MNRTGDNVCTLPSYYTVVTIEFNLMTLDRLVVLVYSQILVS